VQEESGGLIGFRFKTLGYWLRKSRRKNMKKFIAVTTMLSIMFFGFGTSQALIGMPDDVPGTDILVPWIYVSMPGFGNENTLITVTDVKDPIGGNPTTLHCVMHDIDSNPVANWNVELTPFDVYVDDGMSILDTMAVGVKAQLEIDIDGDGINDHWAGYVLIRNATWGNFPIAQDCNHLISHVYQVYLTAGMAAGINGVSYEHWDGWFVDPRQLGAIFPNPPRLWPDEAFSANSLMIGKSLVAGRPIPVPDAGFFRLMPRYFILDDVGVNLLMIWTETFYTRIPVVGVVHCNFYDEEENVLSSNIPLDHELNILKVRDIIPAGLFSGVYPWGGWIDIRTPDLVFDIPGDLIGYDGDVNGNLVWDGAERQWLGYSWQRAMGPAMEAWEVIHPVHRETVPTL
jgi:hypothetical protein